MSQGLPLTKSQTFNVAQAYDQAQRLQQQGRLQEAERLCLQVLQARPDHVDALHTMALICHAKGQQVEALQFISAAMQVRKPAPAILLNRGIILTALARPEEALESFEQAIKLKSKFAEAHFNRGNALSALGRDEEALEAYKKAIVIKPDLTDAHFNRGVLLLKLGRYDEALKATERALALNPRHAKAHNTHGATLVKLGRYEEALASHEQALAIDPAYAVACNNRNRVLYLLNRFDEGLERLEAAQAQRPNDPEVSYIRGRILLSRNRNDEAAASFQRALTLQPDHADARFGDCFAEVPIIYDNEDEIVRRRLAHERKLRALREDVEAGRLKDVAKAITTIQPFYLAYQGYNDRDLQALYGGMISAIIERQYPPAALATAPASGERIRVGIVSGFFRQHSNWKMPIKGWLSQLDRKRFQVFGYQLDVERDAVTDVAAGLCDRFVQRALDVAGWRREILADSPHVLIYPGIQMDTISFQLAAQRLAPVQCNSWGHPETSGLPTLDYFLSSDLMEPPDAADHYTERLVRLPNLSIYYEPVDTPAVALTRQELGLRPDATVFWSGQSVFKYLPQYDAVFVRIAKQAPNSQFVFLRHNGSVADVFQARLARAFSAHGLIASDYCVFLDSMDQNTFIAAQKLCDVFLDSIGWSGCNSAMEGLQSNLPVVTVPGALMRSRHSMAILQMMGVADTIAHTLDDYVAIAVRLATAPDERRALSRRIAENKQRLYRDRSCIAALEDFLERAVREAATQDCWLATLAYDAVLRLSGKRRIQSSR